MTIIIVLSLTKIKIVRVFLVRQSGTKFSENTFTGCGIFRMRSDRNGDVAKSVSLNFSSGHAVAILRFQLSKSYTFVGYFIHSMSYEAPSFGM